MGITILQGDCLEHLATLDDQSVHCCVTSPPYWGLRDYGVDGQLGLEATPEAYVEGMVAVFREVRRVLRDDGTLWLNLGDSYNGIGGPGKQNGGPIGPTAAVAIEGTKARRISFLKPKDLVGIPWRVAFALQQPWYKWKIPSESMRAWVAGIVDGEGCITILRTKSSHSESLSFPPVVQVRMCDTEPLERLVSIVGSSYGKPQHAPSSIVANQRPSYQWKAVSNRAAELIAEIYPFLTCKRKQAIVAWNHQLFRSGRGNQYRKPGDIEKEQFCKDLINQLNQRQPVDIPSWMREPAVIQEPGWYLRQDLIWHKPNPMPESVRDRCTKAHEYIFLLSKSERYYFDQEAIKEDATGRAPGNKRPTKGGRHYGDGAEEHRTAANLHNIGARETRNRRSVWTVTTKPFKGAHFATFPPDLITPCILAGCPEGGKVLDPFFGAGTTGLVAKNNHRSCIGIELNPVYVNIARERLQAVEPTLF